MLPSARFLNLRCTALDTLFSSVMNPRTKRIFDLVAIFVLGSVCFLPALGIAFVIWLDTGRPIFFTQTRVGRDGRHFRLFKFRTLHPDCGLTRRPQAHATRIGRLLRRWALDELPQLWNVARGEMSLIGPRPVLPAEADHYDPHQRQRLSVRPGLTGWAQVHGRNALSWQERIAHDLWYVRHRSLMVDLYILGKTPHALLSGDGVYGPGNHDPNAHDLAAHRSELSASIIEGRS